MKIKFIPSRFVLSIGFTILVVNQFVISPFAKAKFGVETALSLNEERVFYSFLLVIAVLGILLLGEKGLKQLLKLLKSKELREAGSVGRLLKIAKFFRII